MIYLIDGPWTWDGDEGMSDLSHPSNWDEFSLLSDFLCAQEPCEPIVSKAVLEFPQNQYHKCLTMELFGMMQHSPATAEGTYWPALEY